MKISINFQGVSLKPPAIHPPQLPKLKNARNSYVGFPGVFGMDFFESYPNWWACPTRNGYLKTPETIVVGRVYNQQFQGTGDYYVDGLCLAGES